MPVVIDEDLIPTYVAKPDMRFGTTFLSSKYRDYAVNGESIVDKATGEIFIKRPADGRVVSFFQNKKYLYDLMLQLRVMILNNENFYYPAESDTAYYLCTDYDIAAANNEQELDLLVSDYEQIIDSRPEHKIRFRLSQWTNGFFILPTVRDSDKVFVEFLSNQYDTLLPSYNGHNQDCLLEREKLKKNLGWKSYNADIYFTVDVTSGSNTRSYSRTCSIRIGEDCYVPLPMHAINDDFGYIDENDESTYRKIAVTITKIEFPKMRFMYDYREVFGEEFKRQLPTFGYPDYRIILEYLTIHSFIDKSIDVELNGNEFLVALMDMEYVNHYMGKIARLQADNSFIVSINKPTDADFAPNTMWAERVSETYKNGETIRNENPTQIMKLARWIAPHGMDNYMQASTADNKIDPDKFSITPYNMPYTQEDVNNIIAKTEAYVRSKTETQFIDSEATDTDIPAEATTNTVIFKKQ